MEQVSWDAAQVFVRKLSQKTGKQYSLPSEAEWEYAARAGSQTDFSFGDDVSQLSRYGWFATNSENQTHPVGEKLPNRFGLYDTHGNVGEWTQDCWNFNYVGAPNDGSAWTNGNCHARIYRGGSYNYSPDKMRIAMRNLNDTSFRSPSVGLRVARNLN